MPMHAGFFRALFAPLENIARPNRLVQDFSCILGYKKACPNPIK